MNPETWSNILYTYGPFALLVFLVFIIERKVHAAWKQSDKNNQRDQTFFRRLYGLTWVVIFGATFCCIYAWWQINLTRRPQITGRIENLPNSETLTTTCADLYLHKNPKGIAYSDYDLLLINKDHKQWAEGSKVKFIIQTPNPNSKEEDLYEYSLLIRSAFYRTGVLLRRQSNRLILDENGQETDLVGVPLPINTVPSIARIESATWSFLPTAYAQTDEQIFSEPEFRIGLESPDIIVRRQTRYALSLQDQKIALPWINNILKDRTSSYRLRLGVLVALNNMPNLAVESLLPETKTAIQYALNDPDQTLRNEALALAKKYDLIPVTIYEHNNWVGQSQVFGPGVYRYDQARLGSLPNDTASSLRVAKGFSVRLCENEGDGKGSGICEIKPAGKYNLVWGPKGVADRVSFIQVFKLKEN
ncbi:MAG TPA: hypothetical protein VJR02_01980 [Pyrinomonadaceae bacterium]|nr:hypothetical protein [Pyrinomonadaceae bacterium]